MHRIKKLCFILDRNRASDVASFSKETRSVGMQRPQILMLEYLAQHPTHSVDRSSGLSLTLPECLQLAKVLGRYVAHESFPKLTG